MAVSGEESGKPGAYPDGYDDMQAYGDVGAVLELSDFLRPPQTDLEQLLAARPQVKPAPLVGEIVDHTEFHERHAHWQVVRDLIGLIRHQGDGQTEGYEQKLERERRRGKVESAAYGDVQILGQKAVLYVMNWDYFAGSLGEVAGEKFVRAAELAEQRDAPLISIYASSGARQQENTLALVQMQRMVEAIERFKRQTNRLHIAILAGQVWGGVSASAVPNGDLLVALAGTDYGFSGPRVIETFQGSKVEPGAQSVEAAFKKRKVDVVAHDADEAVEYIARLLKVSGRDKHYKLKAEALPEPPDVPVDATNTFRLGKTGYSQVLLANQPAEVQLELMPRRPKPASSEANRLMAGYEALLSDAGRPDSEFIMQHAFDKLTPLYNHYVIGDRKVYPAIIASIGRIGEQPFLVIGNQPSYEYRGSYVRKMPANAKPQDFRYQVRMMELGKRLGLPLVFLTDTPGAEPTLASEDDDQSGAIASAIAANVNYPHPVVTVITGELGSGGGLATGPFSHKVLMLERALSFVSEPNSTASILYNKANPTIDEIARTLSTMRATAKDHEALGLVDTIVPEDDNPYQTAVNVRQGVLKAFVEIQDKSARQRRKIVRQRLRPRGINTDAPKRSLSVTPFFE